jgi:hypothetical protein
MIAGLGSILLALCGFPEVLRCFKNKRCDIGYPMLLLWLIGELLLIVFAIQTKQFILLINYFANVIFVLIMLYYKKAV